MNSRVAVRIAGLVLVIGVVWYVTHLNSEIARMRAASDKAHATAPANGAASAPAAAPAAPAAAPAAPRVLTPEQRQAMLTALGGAAGNPVWFAVVPNNPEAAAFQQSLEEIFKEAGWRVDGKKTVSFPMKPGVFIFAADEEPPDYLSAVHSAFESAGIQVVSGRGYREFVRQKKEETPNWVGLELGESEAYVVAVGRAG